MQLAMAKNVGVQPNLQDLELLLESLLIPGHCAEVAEVLVHVGKKILEA